MSDNFKNLISGVLTFEKGALSVIDNRGVRETLIDKLVWEAVFGLEEDKKISRWTIWNLAQNLGIYPSSINDLYMVRGEGKTSVDFTTPAINVRGIAYDMGRSIFSAAIKTDTKAVIFEIARSEMGYTDQTPSEFSSVILGSAIKEGWSGPVFLQGDHYQAKSEVPGTPKDGDIDEIKKLIRDSISAGFYNIDIDMSTLVDLTKKEVPEQQKNNIYYSKELLDLVRSLEPKNYQISVGCEIGHIGGKNSNINDFNAFMAGFENYTAAKKGMSKIAVQTGTSHGGVVNPDGTIASVDVDFSIHSEISKLARENYKIGGTVQHGASTLPEDMFNNFPKNGTLEIHLATGFQNMIMDHPAFPKELTQTIYNWLDTEQVKERESGQTDEQFHYKARKKAWGKFKKECWQIEESKKTQIRQTLSSKFEFLFKELGVTNTSSMVGDFVSPNPVTKKLSDFGISDEKITDVDNLSD